MKKPILATATADSAAAAVPPPAFRRGLGRTLARLLAGMATAFREGIIATWNLAGSRQVLNLVLLSLVLLAGFMAQRMERIERHLDSVAEAQRITGFAVMKQLQALGLAPREGKDGAAVPAGAAPPAPAPIDPTLLENQSARLTPASTPAATPPASAPAPAVPAVK